MRTNRIELTKYLFHRRVFIIVISTCFCDWLKQTLKHVMFFYFNHNCTRENMLLVVETQNLRRLLNINKKVRMMIKWLMKTNILAQFSLTIECLEWFRSVMWAKRMHTKSTDKSQYFVFKMTMRRLDDEKTKRDFYSSEDFSFIHIVYNNSRMTSLKLMTQRVWNIIIIIMKFCYTNKRNKFSQKKSSNDAKNLHTSVKEASIDDNMNKFNEHSTSSFNEMSSFMCCFVD